MHSNEKIPLIRFLSVAPWWVKNLEASSAPCRIFHFLISLRQSWVAEGGLLLLAGLLAALLALLALSSHA